MNRTAAGSRSLKDELERGQFSDGIRIFNVRASSEEAPDSFQVYANGSHDDIVLVISGLNSGGLKAAWGHDWRTASDAWKEWAESQAFMVFYNGEVPRLGRVRVCNG